MGLWCAATAAPCAFPVKSDLIRYWCFLFFSDFSRGIWYSASLRSCEPVLWERKHKMTKNLMSSDLNVNKSRFYRHGFPYGSPFFPFTSFTILPSVLWRFRPFLEDKTSMLPCLKSKHPWLDPFSAHKTEVQLFHCKWPESLHGPYSILTTLPYSSKVKYYEVLLLEVRGTGVTHVFSDFISSFEAAIVSRRSFSMRLSTIDYWAAWPIATNHTWPCERVKGSLKSIETSITSSPLNICGCSSIQLILLLRLFCRTAWARNAEKLDLLSQVPGGPCVPKPSLAFAKKMAMSDFSCLDLLGYIPASWLSVLQLFLKYVLCILRWHRKSFDFRSGRF